MEYSFDEPSREMRWTFEGMNAPADVVFVVPEVAHGINLELDGNVAVTVEPALINGYKQKIGDAAAIARSTTTGLSATAHDKRAAMQKVVDNLNAGLWNAVRAAAIPKTVNVEALAIAIAAGTGKQIGAIYPFIEAKTEEGRKALTNSKQFAEGYLLQLTRQRPLRQLSAKDSAELDAIE